MNADHFFFIALSYGITGVAVIGMKSRSRLTGLPAPDG